MNISEQEKLLLSLIIAQGKKLFYDENDTEIQGYQNLLITFSQAQPKRQTHEKILGYVDLTSRYLENDFKSHFRMARISMEVLISVVGSHLNKESLGRPQENAALQCLVAVWVMANQESYRSIADRFNISKSTVFNCLRRVCEILNNEAGNFIKWPEETTANTVIEGFKKIKSFPGVIGAIDGCHIDILPIKQYGTAYINRKGRTSMVLQGVCDHNCKFTDIFVGFPGSVHDARVFLRSAVAERCKTTQIFPYNSHLLGDSAYPLGPHILVPFRNTGHLNHIQKTYNLAHAATRAMIERAFGMLKGRWRRLKYLELHNTALIPTVISAACVLHNFCIEHNEEISEVDLVIEDGGEVLNPENVLPRLNRSGEEKRNSVVNIINNRE